MGTRLSEETVLKPKPMVEIGGRLLPGFDKAKILATLKGLPETQKSI